MTQYWLMKTEPTTYSIDDLEKAQSIYPLIKSGENIKIIEQIIKDQQI